MRYLDSLPIVNINNKQFRNIFNRVVATLFKEDQLVKYEMKDFETLASVAQNWYSNADYWWVIALVNNIYDINFDVPMPSDQIEMISNELSQDYIFEPCTLAQSYTTMTLGSNSKNIVFDNPNNEEYTVIINVRDLASKVHFNYGYEYVASNSFNIITSANINADTQFVYMVVKKPRLETVQNLSLFSDYYDLLLKESDAKRTLLMIRKEYLSSFISKFMLALEDKKIPFQRVNLNKQRYYQEINLLRQYEENIEPEFGVLAHLQKDRYTPGISYFDQVIVPNYEYEFISFATLKENLDLIGKSAIKQRVSLPRVYNTGNKNIKYDFVSFSLDRLKYTDTLFLNRYRIYDGGIATIDPSTGLTLTTKLPPFYSHDVNLCGLFMMPILNNTVDFDNISQLAYTVNNYTNLAIRCFDTTKNPFQFMWVAVALDYPI